MTRARSPWTIASLLWLLLVPSLAAAQEVSLSGWFHIVWVDPPAPGEPLAHYYLVDAQGTSTRLLIAPSSLATLSPLVLQRRMVVVRGRFIAPAMRPDQETPSTVPVIEVTSVTTAAGTSPNNLVLPAIQSGPRPYVTILCKFSDDPSEPQPSSTYRTWMTSVPGYPWMDSYWREVSDENINLNGSVVVGWYTLPQPRSYYVPVGGGLGSVNFGKLVDDCTGVADGDVYYPQFAGVNMQFNGDLNGGAYGGTWALSRDGQTTIVGMTWMAPWSSLGTYGHEMGHSFGLPHSGGPYTQTYDSKWDVMSCSGCTYYDPIHGVSLGQHTIAYHKDLLGWIPAARKYTATAGSLTIDIERSEIPGPSGYLSAEIPIQDSPGQFYTVEARRLVGYDAHLPGEAVILHRVNPNGMRNGYPLPAQVVDPDGNGDPNDAGAMWVPGETFTDNANGITIAVVGQSASHFQVRIDIGGSALTIVSTTDRPPGIRGAAYSDHLEASGGTGSYTWSLTSGSLPAGLALSTSGEILGVPTVSGAFEFTASVTSGGATASKAFRLQVTDPFRIVSARTRPSATVGVFYSDQLETAGATGPVTWTLNGGGLPPGLSLDSRTGQVAGEPTQAGSFTFSVIATSGGQSASADFSLTVAGGLSVLTDSLLSQGYQYQYYNAALEAAGGTGSYTWSVSDGALPSGLTLSSIGNLEGAPTSAGTFRFTGTVVSGAESASREFVLEVAQSLELSASGSLEGAVAFPYSLQIVASGGVGGVAFELNGSLAPGLSLNTATGVISGTPAQKGYYPFTITATSGPFNASIGLGIEVYDQVVITSDSLRPAAVRGLPYSDQIEFTGGRSYYEWRIVESSSADGPVIEMHTGRLSFTPTQAGTVYFTANLTVTGVSLFKKFAIVVSEPLVVTSDSPRKRGIMGASYSDTLVSNGGVGIVSWTISAGALPNGVTLNAQTGEVGGIPTQSGQFHVRIRARAGAQEAEKDFMYPIERPVLQAINVVNQLLAVSSTLSQDELRFLDLQGNRNGRFDIGDVRAWLVQNNLVSPIKIPGLDDLPPP